MRFWLGWAIMVAGILAAFTIKSYDYRFGLIVGIGLIAIGAGVQIWCFVEAWHSHRKMIQLHKRNMARLQDLTQQAEAAETDEDRIAIIHELCDHNPEAAIMLKGFLDSNSLRNDEG